MASADYNNLMVASIELGFACHMDASGLYQVAEAMIRPQRFTGQYITSESTACLAGPGGMVAAAVSQLDAAQVELEAGNAALLQSASFLVEMLALQAAAPGMQPVRVLDSFHMHE